MYYVYRAVAPNGKYYIGITNNFKRRLKEHRTSVYPFGCALRKHGIDSFTFYLMEVDSVKEALQWEEFLITQDEVDSSFCYNACVGGRLSNVLAQSNPMQDIDVLNKHPSLFTSENNPMKDLEVRKKMIESQDCKKVYVCGKEYYGVREAARNINVSRQCLVYRLKSNTFPDYYYL